MGGSLSAHSLSAHLSILLQSDLLFSPRTLMISTNTSSTPFITTTLEMKHLTTTKVLSVQELSVLCYYFFELYNNSLMKLVCFDSAHNQVIFSTPFCLKLIFGNLMWALLCNSFPLPNHAVRGPQHIKFRNTNLVFFSVGNLHFPLEWLSNKYMVRPPKDSMVMI